MKEKKYEKSIVIAIVTVICQTKENPQGKRMSYSAAMPTRAGVILFLVILDGRTRGTA